MAAMMSSKPAAPSQGEEMPGKWISVKERFPDNGDIVLICLEATEANDTHRGEKEVHQAAFIDGGWFEQDENGASFNDDSGTWEINYWQPLPSPPGEKLAPPSQDLVIEIARELYDRFVMGGWEPKDVYAWLTATLAKPAPSQLSPAPEKK